MKKKTEKPTPLEKCVFAWNLITKLINDDLGHFWPWGPEDLGGCCWVFIIVVFVAVVFVAVVFVAVVFVAVVFIGYIVFVQFMTLWN